jgi:hypothetical protein
VTDTLVSLSNISNVRVDLSQIASDQNWVEAVRSALTNWNSMSGTRIYFTESSPADIQFVFADLRSYGDGVIAVSTFPTGSPGRTGNLIRINIYAPSLSSGQKTYTMTHELGHAIGFRHTNWQGYQCPPYGTIIEPRYGPGANQVGGTPAIDDASIMNACSGDRSWTGFSGYDQIAASNVYPPVITLTESNSGGYPLVYVAASRGPVSLDLKIEYSHTEWYDHLQQFQTTYWYEVVGVVESGSSTPIGHQWGSAYCSDWADYPYPQEEAYYYLVVSYPQGTSFIGSAPAHVMDYSGSPGYMCT